MNTLIQTREKPHAGSNGPEGEMDKLRRTYDWGTTVKKKKI
jgi:hypothetical protein